MLNWDDLTEDQKLAAARLRIRLPDRRTADTVSVNHTWAPATTQEVVEPLLVTIGRYEDGRIGEVFIDGNEERGRGRVSDRTRFLRHDVAMLISIALQHGATVDELRGAIGRAEVNVMGETRLMPHTIVGTVLDALAAEEGAA